jgi:formyl-CoA transferase
VQHLGAATTVQSPALGEIELVSQSIKLSRTPSTIAAAPPERGEHSDEILQSIGYDATEIADFHKRNVV